MTGFQDLDSALAHDHFHLTCLPPSRLRGPRAPHCATVHASWRSKCIMQASSGPAPAILEWYGHCVRLSVKKLEGSGSMKNFEN